MKYLILLITFTISFSILSQQGKNFSLWFLNNMQQNPATTGTNDNNLKFFANFRYQYFSVTDKPYRTFSASVEGKAFKSKTKFHYFGIGGNLTNDVSGDGQYSVINFSVPVSYHLFINENHSISAGIAPGIYQRSLDVGNVTWGNQWTGMEFDPTIPSNESFPVMSLSKFNISTGVFYNYQKSYTDKIYGGFSVNNITRPDLLFNDHDKLYMRFVAHGGMKYKFFMTPFGLSPQMYLMFQGPNRSIVFGSNLDFYLKEPSQKTSFNTPTLFSLGFYHRLGDAMIVNMQYTTHGWTFAASYDANVNSMMPHSRSIGGVEVAVMYDIILNKKKKFIY